MIMSFDSEFDDVFLWLKELFENEDFEVIRADDLVNQQNILKDIVLSIYNSDLIVAELTGLNPNVFYELGLAHALRKNTVLLTQDIEELPFDLRPYRVIPYSTHFSKINELEEALKKILHEYKKGSLSFGSPVSDWLPSEQENGGKRDLHIIKDCEREESVEKLPEEKGFIDFWADSDESIREITTLVNLLSEETQLMTQEINKTTLQIFKAVDNTSDGTPSYLRKLYRKGATVLKKYSEYVEKLNKKYQKQLSIFEDSILNVVNNPRIGDDAEQLEGFIETMDTTKHQISSTRKKVNAMAESAGKLKGMERSLNRAAKLVEQEIKIFADLLYKTTSILDRVVVLGKQRIENTVEKKIN